MAMARMTSAAVFSGGYTAARIRFMLTVIRASSFEQRPSFS
jgi:hypothetical protein